jgi:hypothetical protein
VAGSFAVVLLDERFLSEERLERAWLPSSRTVALVVFGPIVLPLHFARTRGHLRSLRGVLGYPLGFALGVVATFLVLFVAELALEGLAWALGVSLQME